MIRKAGINDIPRILELLDSARAIMRSDGNHKQWKTGYPSEDAIRRDIALGAGRMVGDYGYFAILPSPDPTYSLIEGAWLDDEPYCVLHRIASTPESHGVFAAALGHAFESYREVRIDTHEDNRIMRRLIEKAGFTYCGIIYVADGTPRLAYQKNA